MLDKDGNICAYNWCIYYIGSNVEDFNNLCVTVICDLCETSVITINRSEKVIKVLFNELYTKQRILHQIYVYYHYYQFSINIDVDIEEEDKIDIC